MRQSKRRNRSGISITAHGTRSLAMSILPALKVELPFSWKYITEVMFSPALVCLLVGLWKKCVFDGKVAHGSLKKQLDLGSNPNRIMLGLWLVRWVHYYVPCGYVLPGIHLTVTTLWHQWHPRADERHGNHPQGNQELLVVRDKVGRTQVSLQ